MFVLKRLFALVLCLTLAFTMVACVQDTTSKENKNEDKVTATTPDESTATTMLPTTLDATLDYIDQHTTVTENEDGTTTYTLTTDTKTPAIPTVESVSPSSSQFTSGTTKEITTATRKSTTVTRKTTTTTQKSATTTRKSTTTTTTKKRTTTTTKKRTTTTNTNPTQIVTEGIKTTTQKPAPPPTIPTTTTTTVATEQGATTTTEKKFSYEYVTNQDHTWLPLEERYYYSLMNDEWKDCYRQLDEAVRHLDESITFSANITEDFKHRLYFIYMMDTPELFFLSKSITISSSGDGTSGYIFAYSVGSKNSEFCDRQHPITDGLREKIRAKQAVFDDAVYAITSTIPKNAPAVVKQRMIYDKILKTSAYNLPAAENKPSAVGGAWDNRANDNWTAYGIMINHTGVCESYSEAFQTLCNAVGINCTGIEGTARGGGHKWNAVQLDGEWYQCDITFDDPIGGDPNDAYHTYFNLNDAAMRKLTHSWSKTCWEGYFASLKYPTCTATKYNWENFVTLYGK